MTFANWLISDAGAGWIFGIVSTTGLLITLRRQARPPRLVARQTFSGSLVQVRQEIKDAIEVRLRGKVIPDLGHVGVELFNSGSATIKDALVRVRFPDDTKILDAGHLEEHPVTPCTVYFADNELSLGVPFLNPVKDHGHTIAFSILVSGPTRVSSVIGAGDGWSARLDPAPTWTETAKAVKRGGMAAIAWAAIYAGAILPVINRYLQIPSNEFSARVVLLMMPFLIPMVVFVWYDYRLTRRLSVTRRRN